MEVKINWFALLILLLCLIFWKAQPSASPPAAEKPADPPKRPSRFTKPASTLYNEMADEQESRTSPSRDDLNREIFDAMSEKIVEGTARNAAKS